MGRRPDADQIDFIGERLKQEIEDQGFNQKQLSKDIGYDPSTLSKWIKRDRINAEVLKVISKVLSKDPRWFTGEIDENHEVFQDNNGDFVIINPPNPSELFDLQFSDPEEYHKRTDEIVKNAQTDGAVMMKSEILERKRRERKKALDQLDSLLHSGYMYPYYKHAESAETLSNLLEEFRMYLQTLPDTHHNGKERK